MEQSIYTVNQAADILKVNIEYLYELATNAKLKLGVEARGWFGSWCPSFDAHPGGIMHDVMPETHINMFWYIHPHETNKLLTNHNRESTNLVLFTPFNPKQLAKDAPEYFTETGVFWVYKNDKRHTPPLIGLNDLRISLEEITRLKKTIFYVKENSCDVPKNKIIGNLEGKILKELGRSKDILTDFIYQYLRDNNTSPGNSAPKTSHLAWGEIVDKEYKDTGAYISSIHESKKNLTLKGNFHVDQQDFTKRYNDQFIIKLNKTY